MIQSEPECLAHGCSPLVVSKPRSVICVRARNSSVTMSAALWWEIGDPNTLMNTQTDTASGQAARPPCAHEAVAAELGIIRERVFEARERLMGPERKIEDTLPVLSPGAGCLEMGFWRLKAMQQRLELGALLTNAASSARARFDIHLEHSCLDGEVEVVDMWLALLRRPMLVNKHCSSSRSNCLRHKHLAGSAFYC